jgi:hypothetical protein
MRTNFRHAPRGARRGNARAAVDGWSRPAILDLHTGKLTSINAPAFYGPLDIAW